MGELVKSNIQNLLESLLVVFQVNVVEENHPPNGSLVGLQERTRGGLSDVDNSFILLISTYYSKISNRPLGDIAVGDGERIA